MKNIITLAFILMSAFAVADSWTQKADLPAYGRSGAFSFVVNGKAYIGGGNSQGLGLLDVWEYDPSIDTWTQKADFAGNVTRWSNGFAIDGKGYVALGSSTINISFKKDVWQYDIVTNTWLQKADFPGVARALAMAFVVNGKAYVTGGFAFSMRTTDVWSYDAAVDVWTRLDSFPGYVRSSGTAFSIGNKAYIVSGYTGDTGGSLLKDVWEYNPVGDSWTQMADMPGFARAGASGFSIKHLGFIALGDTNSYYYLRDVWQFNSITNIWTRKTDFPIPRNETISFTIGNKAYIGLGMHLYNPSDLWEYTPDSLEFVADTIPIGIFPNPATDYITISTKSKSSSAAITITNVQGKKIFSNKFSATNGQIAGTINISNFSKGIYFVEVSDGENKTIKKFVKQ